VLPPQEAAAQYVPEVAWQADTVVVLTNLEYQAALALAGAVPGIDLVIAALPDVTEPRSEGVPSTGALVAVADQPLPKHSGRRVGVLTVMVAGDGTLTAETWQSQWMDKGIADDPEMDTLLSKFW
jgi:2',3'-cyclic-nucleotide 2'-phosphodiesterase (5'-nucleotidase family)